MVEVIAIGQDILSDAVDITQLAIELLKFKKNILILGNATEVIRARSWNMSRDLPQGSRT